MCVCACVCVCVMSSSCGYTAQPLHHSFVTNPHIHIYYTYTYTCIRTNTHTNVPHTSCISLLCYEYVSIDIYTPMLTPIAANTQIHTQSYHAPPASLFFRTSTYIHMHIYDTYTYIYLHTHKHTCKHTTHPVRFPSLTNPYTHTYYTNTYTCIHINRHTSIPHTPCVSLFEYGYIDIEIHTPMPTSIPANT